MWEVADYRRAFRGKRTDWDKHPFLLGTPTGVIDLADDGKRLINMRDYQITRSTLVDPANDSRGAVKYLTALKMIYKRNPEVIDFLQEFGGYCPTADVREDILVVAFGTGGNGKTVVFKPLTDVAGTYAHVMAVESVMETTRPPHPEDMARLERVRLAIVPEIPENAAGIRNGSSCYQGARSFPPAICTARRSISGVRTVRRRGPSPLRYNLS
jgi:putative DNA primase/helicase